jgi:hypothetical protein
MTREGDQDGSAGHRRHRPERRLSLSRPPRWLWITASVIALASLISGVVYAATSSSPGLAASGAGTGGSGVGTTTPGAGAAASASLRPGSSASTAQAKGRSAIAEPRSAAALGLTAGALALPGNLKTAAANWYAGRGGTALTVVSTQAGTVTQAGSVREYAEMKSACSALAADVKTAQAAPPIPEAAMQALYAKALSSLATGAADCMNAISDHPDADGDEQVLTQENPALLGQSTGELQVGAKYLFQATAEIKALR